MLENTLSPFTVWIWTQVSPSAKIAKSGVTVPSLVKFKAWSVLNITAYIRANIIIILLGDVRQISRLILPDLKQNKGNLAHILSNTWTTKRIIK